MKKFTYHALLTTLLTIRAFDIEDKQVTLSITIEPNAFGRLLTALRLIHNLECSVKEQVEQCTLS